VIESKFTATLRSLLGRTLNELVADGCAQCIATDLKWGEGPAFVAALGLWVFSDIPNNRMLSWSRREGLRTFRAPAHFANGNSIDNNGALLTCEHGTRRISRTDNGGGYSVLCSDFEGKRLNSPNDIVQHHDGSIWFSDPTYGILSDVEGYRAPSEQAANRVYRLDVASGILSAEVSSLQMPNGLCFSPDGITLYVADSGADMGPEVPFNEQGPREVHIFQLSADFRVQGPGTVFARVSRGVPDGIRCDADGFLWVSSGQGLECFASDGTHLGVIETPQTLANLAFGDGSVMLALANSVYLIELS